MKTRANTGLQSERLRYGAAGLSLFAAAIHAVLVPEHWSEWWGYGLFFVSAFAAQGIYGILLLVQPWRYAQIVGVRHNGERYARLFFLLGITGNAAIIGMYLITRTIGIPFFGPLAGEVEPIAPIDIVSKITELVLVGCLVVLIRRSGR